jgi:hypothetical protein
LSMTYSNIIRFFLCERKDRQASKSCSIGYCLLMGTSSSLSEHDCA